MVEPAESDFFVVIPTGVLKEGPAALAVYAVLRDLADRRTDECWPSHRTIAGKAGLSERKTRDVLAQLRAAGWVTWAQRTRGGKPTASNVYRVYARPQNPPAPRADPPAPRADPPAPRADELLTKELIPTEPQELSLTAAAASPTDPVENPEQPAAGFDDFWLVWPRKVGKRKALHAWQRALAREADPAAITTAAAALATALAAAPDRDEARRFTPHPTTWLDRDGWLDEPPPARPAPQVTPTPPRLGPGELVTADAVPPPAGCDAAVAALRQRRPPPTPQPQAQAHTG